MVALLRVEVDVFDHKNWVVTGEGRVHHPDVVVRRRRRHNSPARRGGKDSRGIHQVLRAVAGSHGHLGAQDQRNGGFPTEHVSGLPDLVEYLIGSDPQEIGIHEFDYGPKTTIESHSAAQARQTHFR
jgi:hypothetical protein